MKERVNVIVLTLLVLSALAPAQQPPPPPEPGYALEGRPGYVIVYDPEAQPWESFDVAGIPAGLQKKILSQSPTMGAVSLMTYVPVGWRQSSPGYHNVDEEIFVLEGDLTIGDAKGEQKLTKYSFAYFPAGMVHGPAYSRHGAVLLHWFKGKPDFVASAKHKQGARVHAQVRDWNHFQSPWYIGEPFPAYRVGGNFPGAIHKLVRQDPDTGEMTWLTFGASIAAASRGAGNFGGGYEVHPSFEEYFFLEKTGDNVIGECLEEGLTPVRYGNRSYWWRPGKIGHGGPTSHGEPGYTISLVRTGTKLWADYYTDCTYKQQIEFTGSGFRNVEKKGSR